MDDPADIMEWVERLGGWGVVVWVVWRMMRSNERMIEAGEEDRRVFRAAVDEFRKYRSEDDRAHRDIIDTQKNIIEAMRAR
jgi:hypothetical protein